MLNRNIGLNLIKNPEEGNPRMRRGAELTANELDNTDITQVCKQVLQGNINS